MTPTIISLGEGTKATQLELGYYQTCAVVDDETNLKCWGWDGNFAEKRHSTPTMVNFKN
jgi:hypothetical protein